MHGMFYRIFLKRILFLTGLEIPNEICSKTSVKMEVLATLLQDSFLKWLLTMKLTNKPPYLADAHY